MQKAYKLFICLSIYLILTSNATCAQFSKEFSIESDKGYYYLYHKGLPVFKKGYFIGEAMETVGVYIASERIYSIIESEGYPSINELKHYDGNNFSVFFNSNFTNVYSFEPKIETGTFFTYVKGRLCSSSSIDITEYSESSYMALKTAACQASVEPPKTDYKRVANDLVFEIEHEYETQRMPNIKLIALGFYPNYDLDSIGCIKNCSFIKHKDTYIGRIGYYNEEIKIGKINGVETGYSRTYPKYKSSAYEGIKKENELTLIKKNDKGEIILKLIGKLDDGSFTGQWFNLRNGEIIETLPFQMYVQFSL